jgi:hypothetical protein
MCYEMAIIMDREKKLGIGLMVFGICFALIFLPFISGYEKGKGTFQNFFNVGITLKKEKAASEGKTFPSALMRILPVRLPYRFILAIGIFLIFAGIVKIDISRRKDSDKDP